MHIHRGPKKKESILHTDTMGAAPSHTTIFMEMGNTLLKIPIRYCFITENITASPAHNKRCKALPDAFQRGWKSCRKETFPDAEEIDASTEL